MKLNTSYAAITNFILIIFLTSSQSLYAQWLITAPYQEFIIDFDQNIDNVNAFAFQGAGLQSSPESGMLDSDSWLIVGASDISPTQYGQSYISGDFARGASQGGKITGGLYAMEVENDNYSLGIQSTGNDFTPGSIHIKIRNNTSQTINYVIVEYDIYQFNDNNRSTTVEFAYSLDGIRSTKLPSYEFNTHLESFDTPHWEHTTRSGGFEATIPVGGEFILSWLFSDNEGFGARDEIALDNIKIRLTTADNLPLHVTNFDVKQIKDSIDIAWTIADVPSNHPLNQELEYSGNGKEWSPLNIYDRPRVVINSPLSFHEHYAPLQTGVYYFRLKVKDSEGQIIYSPIKKVIYNEGKQQEFNIYPNPTRNLLNIQSKQIEQPIHITAYSVLGQKVFDQIYKPKHSLQISTTTWSPGTYILLIHQGGKQRSEKIVVQY